MKDEWKAKNLQKIYLNKTKKNRKKKTEKKFEEPGKEISMRAKISSSKTNNKTFLEKKKMKQHIHTKKNYYIRQAGLIYIR